MNSDQTRIQQSMPPVYTIHQTGKPAVVNIGANTNPEQAVHEMLIDTAFKNKAAGLPSVCLIMT